HDSDRAADHGARRTGGSAGTAAGSARAGTVAPAVTLAETDRAEISPRRLARDLRSADDRDCPSRTDFLGAALSNVIGGPVGRHAILGRAAILTPLRVMFLIALVFLALGWSTKAPCLQTVGTGPGDQRVANWQNQRAYYELCYSDIVPLYGAELLGQGRFPYKSSWIEKDGSGKPQTRYDGKPAVRYMEYPVLTGLYQYVSMALAKSLGQRHRHVLVQPGEHRVLHIAHRGLAVIAGLRFTAAVLLDPAGLVRKPALAQQLRAVQRHDVGVAQLVIGS